MDRTYQIPNPSPSDKYSQHFGPKTDLRSRVAITGAAMILGSGGQLESRKVPLTHEYPLLRTFQTDRAVGDMEFNGLIDPLFFHN
jgi:hypothetical protein